MATESHLLEFKNSFEKWNKINFKKLYRVELGTGSFKEFTSTLEDIEKKIKRTNEIKVILGDNLLSQFYSQLNQIIEQLNTLANYDDASFLSQKIAIKNNVINYNEQILNVWPQIVAIFNDNASKSEFDRTLKEIRILKDKSVEEAKNIETIREGLTNDLKSFEERYKNEIFSKAELIKQENAFANDSIQFKKISTYWLFAVMGSSIILLLILYLSFKIFCYEVNCYENICKINYDAICVNCNKIILYFEIFKAVTFKLFLVSIFVYFISICIKNYNANMHNFTVNKHKANSLSSALILLEKSKTDEGIDKIISLAATAIFTHQPTAFNNKDPEHSNLSITDKIFEKMK